VTALALLLCLRSTLLGHTEDDCQESRKDKEEDDTEHICGDVAQLKETGQEVTLTTNSVKTGDAKEE
jgi:hypothetical protein